MFLAKAKQFQKSVDYIDKKKEGQGRPTTLAFFASWPFFWISVWEEKKGKIVSYNAM